MLFNEKPTVFPISHLASLDVVWYGLVRVAVCPKRDLRQYVTTLVLIDTHQPKVISESSFFVDDLNSKVQVAELLTPIFRLSIMSVDKILVVVGIIEGRRFPRRPKFKILVEAKFDGEVLSTDPVDHVETPEFTTELAWESDKKTLHQHRLQRTPIKLQCYAVDLVEKRKEAIGYIILDLRSVQMQEFQQQKPQWHALLSSKYQKSKPEIKLIVSFEDESNKLTSPPNQKQETKDADKETDLIPKLDEKEGYYTIGSKSDDAHIFCMSVTIRTAKNLAKVIPSNIELKQQDGFCFFYSLMNNDVISDPFYDFMQPEFDAERASVRIFTSFQTLIDYINQNSSLKVHLCYGKTHLASASISLKPLLMDNLRNGDAAKIEGLFPLTASQSDADSISLNQEDSLVGVTIILRLEKDDIPSLSAMTSVLAAGGDILVPEHPFSPATKDEQRNGSTGKKEKRKSPQVVDNLTGTEKTERKKKEIPDPSVHQAEMKDYGPPRNPQKSKTQRTQQPKMESNHHYCYSIDLRSLKNLDIDNPARFYCRYSYPFFGNSSPILTKPAVEIRRNTDVLLPKSFCAFDFATSSSLLEQTLSRIPLIIEVWQSDVNRKDVIFGVCQIFLSCVFASEKIQVQNGNYRQIHSQLINVLSPDNSKRKVASLHIVLGLEDFGEVNEPTMTSSAHITTQSLCSTSTSTGHEEPGVNNHEQKHVQQQQPVESHELPRDLPEYKAAMELEIWKEQQEELFKNMLQQKEAKLMQTLAEEWKKRDKERETILKRKIDEYNRLEERLRTSIADLEKREKQVANNEVEVARLRAGLLQEHEQKLTILRDASIRMKEDCEYRVELVKLKLVEITEQNQRYKEQIQSCEKRYKDKENEVLIFKEEQMNKPESKLQAELNFNIIEKAELERKLDSTTKSKIHYKQQWGKALRELAKMKQHEQTAAKARLKKQEYELEHMRLRYLAAEEKEVMKSEKEELDNVKAELKKLQELQVNTPPQSQTQPAKEQAQDTVVQQLKPGQSSGIDEVQDQLMNSRIAKLIEERDTLLRTGVYSTDDKIIFELDRQIREAIASKRGLNGGSMGGLCLRGLGRDAESLKHIHGRTNDGGWFEQYLVLNCP
eukprot:gene9838-10847_t